MATLRIAFKVPFLNKNNAAKLQKTPAIRANDCLTDVANLIEGVAGGRHQPGYGNLPPFFSLSLDDNAVAASGTVTCVTVANNSTVQVGGITFTGKTGTPSGSVQFKCGVSANADGAALAAIINAHTTANQYVSAANASGVVTITAINQAIGVIGNGIILSSSDGTNLAVVAMASGANDTGAVSYQY